MFRTTALAHLPDGRFVYGVAGQLFVQNTFGASGKTSISTGALELDPSFIAVRDASNAIVGQGGYFATSNVYTFDPSTPASAVNPVPLSSPQNYAAAYWKSPTSSLEGWLVGGSNGDADANNVIFIEVDPGGALAKPRPVKMGPITGTISTYSGGIATDAAGNLYVATFELDVNYQPTADANKVLKIAASLVDARIQAVLNASPTPAPIPVTSSMFVYKFDSTSNIAVDSLGRVWATGYAVNHLQVFDPATQTMSRIVPEHGAFPANTDVLYTVRNFTRSGSGYVAFLAQDEYGNSGTNLYTGYALDTAIVIPHIDQWRAQHFGVHNLTLETKGAVWGPNADPDHDGMANLLEYAAGTPPNVANAASTTTSVSAGGALQFGFLRDPLNTDLVYIVEVSASLSPVAWQEIARSTAGAPAVSSGAGNVSEIAEGTRIRVTVTDSVAGAPRFARLRVILNAP